MARFGLDKFVVFTANDVLGVLSGKKTKFLVPTKPQDFTSAYSKPLPSGVFCWYGNKAHKYGHETLLHPLYAIDDVLYVKEPWAVEPKWDSHKPYACEGPVAWLASLSAGKEIGVHRPAVHMPLWASRLTLLVSTVTVLKLHDIEESDCESAFPTPLRDTKSFEDVWNERYPTMPFGENPWVMIVGFSAYDCNAQIWTPGRSAITGQ